MIPSWSISTTPPIKLASRLSITWFCYHLRFTETSNKLVSCCTMEISMSQFKFLLLHRLWLKAEVQGNPGTIGTARLKVRQYMILLPTLSRDGGRPPVGMMTSSSKLDEFHGYWVPNHRFDQKETLRYSSQIMTRPTAGMSRYNTPSQIL